ncbi:RidA family protein [Hymenobacter terrenus]|uniref:RidA family protein n=1 Tax=Hymenobacter terrenus TaxID=1629124 RepID=UPI000619B494|nr:RidA family protein [Hymenobacter terrenus]
MSKEYINPPTLLKSTPAYSQAVAVRGSRTIYVSGQVGTNVHGELAGNDLFSQMAQAFQNLGAALAAAGATAADVVKMTYYVVNYSPDQLLPIREMRNQFFPLENRPASTLVGVVALAEPGMLVEIEAVAVTE